MVTCNRNGKGACRAVAVGAWLGVSCVAASGEAQEVDGGVASDAPQVAAPSSAAEPSSAPPAQDAAAASRAQEEAEIAAELGRTQSAAASGTANATRSNEPAIGAESSGSSASARGLSNLMNPAISAVGVMNFGGTSRAEGAATGEDDALRSGIALQEVELRASAIVDPFFRADVSLAGNTEEIGFEEAYLTTLEIPRVTFRAGKMIANLGRHNLLHTHAFPFITAPLPWRALMGAEGLRDPGVSADVLLPLPFYTEITAQAFAGQWAPLEGSIEDDPNTARDESVADRRRDRDLAYVGHLKTLLDVNDATTLELGASYVGGRNGFGALTNVVAADVTLKWKPIEAERYMGFEWTTEYVWIERGDAPTDRKRGGGYTSLRYQFAQQWWMQARGAALGWPAGDQPRTYRGEALLAFVPSEFSAIRVQYALEDEADSRVAPVHELFAQLVFSIGPHPAHAY